MEINETKVIDPVQFQKMIWPHITIYKQQKQILYSLVDNIETYVPAGNELGKDFIAAMALIWFMCSRRPARGAATSVQSDQLVDVLWGEVKRLMDSAVVHLPLQYNHLLLRQTNNDGQLIPQGEFRGQVTQQGEALLGKHLPGHDIPRTLMIADEASGVGNAAYESGSTWADRILVIGNPYPCTNFFYSGVKGGNIPNPSGEGLFRNIIKIKAEDSPNVRYQLKRIEAGLEPDNKVIIEGVLTYPKYVLRRKTWDIIRQTIGLDAEFYEGGEVKMYPLEWIMRSHDVYRDLSKNRRGTAMGVDVGAGGDDSSFWIVDPKGVVQYLVKKTPDTNEIVEKCISFIRLHDLDPRKVIIDRGGGGKQIADTLRSLGYKVRTVSFAESPSKPKRIVKRRSRRERTEEMERRTTFDNRRAEMYYELRLRIDPNSVYSTNYGVFGLPPSEKLLEEEMRNTPLMYDREERIWLPGKRKKKREQKTETMEQLLGRSPDRLDGLVIAVYALSGKGAGSRIGVI